MPLWLLLLLVLQSNARLDHRETLAVDLLGECPITTLELQPVSYCDFFPSNTAVDPFRDGNILIISDAPTAVCISGYLTKVIDPALGLARSSSTTQPDLVTTAPSLSFSAASRYMLISKVPVLATRRLGGACAIVCRPCFALHPVFQPCDKRESSQGEHLLGQP